MITFEKPPGSAPITLITAAPEVTQFDVNVKKDEQGALFVLRDGSNVVESYTAKANENIVFELDPKFDWVYYVGFVETINGKPTGTVKYVKQFTIFKHVGQGWRPNFVLDNQKTPEAWGRWTKL